MTELEPRKAQIELAHEASFTLGPMEIKPALREVVLVGQSQILQPRVMRVLVALAKRRGEVVA